jgi:hypothetical protein
MAGPLGCADEDPGAPTINANRHQWRAPWGANGDPGAPTINAEKRRRWAP